MAIAPLRANMMHTAEFKNEHKSRKKGKKPGITFCCFYNLENICINYFQV